MKQKILKPLLILNLVFIFFYLSLFPNIYFQSFYDIKIDEERFELNPYRLETPQIEVKNLINFYFHKNLLNNIWTIEEEKHYFEVRKIFDFLFLIFILNLISSFLILKNFKLKKIF